jgi:hypothetical protein
MAFQTDKWFRMNSFVGLLQGKPAPRADIQCIAVLPITTQYMQARVSRNHPSKGLNWSFDFEYAVRPYDGVAFTPADTFRCSTDF